MDIKEILRDVNINSETAVKAVVAYCEQQKIEQYQSTLRTIIDNITGIVVVVIISILIYKAILICA